MLLAYPRETSYRRPTSHGIRLMSKRCLLTAVSAVALMTGCRGLCPPPGPMNYQQSRAVINDPFPIEDLGPSDPTMRPPGFEQPLPEAVRTRIVKDTMPQLLQN